MSSTRAAVLRYNARACESVNSCVNWGVFSQITSSPSDTFCPLTNTNTLLPRSDCAASSRKNRVQGYKFTLSRAHHSWNEFGVAQRFKQKVNCNLRQQHDANKREKDRPMQVRILLHLLKFRYRWMIGEKERFRALNGVFFDVEKQKRMRNSEGVYARIVWQMDLDLLSWELLYKACNSTTNAEFPK